MDSVEINSSGRTNPIDDEHVKILEELEDPSERKLFSIEKIKNLDIFKQNPRLFIRLQMCLDQNNYYEAHQAYKTLHFRCMNINHLEEGLELIYNGICFFMENNQKHCGIDLAKTYIESLKKTSYKTLSSQLIEKISYIHSLLRNNQEERTDFTANILKWSTSFNLNLKKPVSTIGYPDIHREFALNNWREKNYPQSRYHFIRSHDGQLCAHMLVEYQLKKGYSSEVDLFITQTVLQFLCLKSEQTANVVFKHYISIHPDIGQMEPPFKLTLVNFIWFLLIAIEGGKAHVFTALCDAYKPSLLVDLSYNDYLDKIGSIYFNLKSKIREIGNPLNNMLRMFMAPPCAAGEDNNQNSEELIDNMDDDDLLD